MSVEEKLQWLYRGLLEKKIKSNRRGVKDWGHNCINTRIFPSCFHNFFCSNPDYFVETFTNLLIPRIIKLIRKVEYICIQASKIHSISLLFLNTMFLHHHPSFQLPPKQALQFEISTPLSSDSRFVLNTFADLPTCPSSSDNFFSLQSSPRNNYHDYDKSNPYKLLIDQCQNPTEMTQAYEKHRKTRNAAKHSELILSRKISPDPILAGLVLNNQPPEFDPRHCITIWARPPDHVMDLIGTVQTRLVKSLNMYIPTKQPTHIPKTLRDHSNKGPLWLMPRTCLHLSALEISHSVPLDTVMANMELLRPHINKFLDPIGNAPVLMRPLICFDSSALALTFVPLNQATKKQPGSYGVHADEQDAQYSYTHYRASLYETATKVAGVDVKSRYQVPSAHVTIARFIQELSPDAVGSLLDEIEAINAWLEAEYSDPSTFAWRIGKGRATECRYGRIWYGGGESEGQSLTLDSFGF